MLKRTSQTSPGIPSDAVLTPSHEPGHTASDAAHAERPRPASCADRHDAFGRDGASPAEAADDDRSPIVSAGLAGWQQVSSALRGLSDGLLDTDISSSEAEDDLSDGDFADALSDGAHVVQGPACHEDRLCAARHALRYDQPCTHSPLRPDAPDRHALLGLVSMSLGTLCCGALIGAHRMNPWQRNASLP
jgi:hypothetical protein